MLSTGKVTSQSTEKTADSERLINVEHNSEGNSPQNLENMMLVKVLTKSTDKNIPRYSHKSHIFPWRVPIETQNLIDSIRPSEPGRWNSLRKIFFDSYDPELQTSLYRVMNGMSESQRFRLIAVKTCQYSRELILRPADLDKCDLRDAEKISEAIFNLIEQTKLKLGSFKSSINIMWRKISNFKSLRKGQHGNLSDASSEKAIENWRKRTNQYREIVENCLETRLQMFQLLNSKVRFEKITGCIHVKTKVWFSKEQESADVPLPLLEIPMIDIYQPTREEEVLPAIFRQMEVFERCLGEITIYNINGEKRVFESLHNNQRHELYEFRVPFDDYPPFMCEAIFKINYIQEIANYKLVSEPAITFPPEPHHIARMFIKKRSNVPLLKLTEESCILTKIEEFGFCLNCFSFDHRHIACDKPLLGIGHSIITLSKKRKRIEDGDEYGL